MKLINHPIFFFYFCLYIGFVATNTFLFMIGQMEGAEVALSNTGFAIFLIFMVFIAFLAGGKE